ncbi:MAG: 8-oxo-dGTP diphosphatase [Candidatus Komeilibacteria bacterium]|nr:8-oxo-dGTP diphosphatase [Candidatus Komeilibacteria bacterium]
MKKLTLCFLKENNKLLLGMKKRGFGAGRWNGFGGKLEDGESIVEAAKRETREECGLEVIDLDLRGRMEFNFITTGERLEVFVFLITRFSGKLVETEEMKPCWFEQTNLPLDEMWPDDRFWLPLFLADKKFRAEFTFGDEERIVEQNIVAVDDIAYE